MRVNFITLSDLHLRRNTPKERLDNFFFTLKRKLSFVVTQANQHNAHFLCGGDVYDFPSVSYETTITFSTILQKLAGDFYTCYGQHDLRYHNLSSIPNTPLMMTLVALKAPQLYKSKLIIDDKIKITICNWSETIPNPDPNYFNILLIHKMVIKDETLWEGQENFITARNLLRITGYDVIVSGDNHLSFYEEYNGKLLINSGSLPRLTKAQKEHKPRLGLFTVTDHGVENFNWIPIPIKDASLCFKSDSQLNLDSEVEVDLEPEGDFIDDLKGRSGEEAIRNISFMNNLITSLDRCEDVMVKKILTEVIDSISSDSGRIV